MQGMIIQVVSRFIFRLWEADKGLARNCEVGQEIPVRYLMDNPYEASLNETSIPVLNPTVFFVLGILMLISSIALSMLHK